MTIVGALVLSAGPAARAATDGNWGEAFGHFLSTIFLYFVLHALLFWGGRLLRHSRPDQASYGRSRLAYPAAALTLVVLLAGMVAPPH